MKFAEKFNRPVICIVDTPNAHPDKQSEERGQSMAIAENLADGEHSLIVWTHDNRDGRSIIGERRFVLDNQSP